MGLRLRDLLEPRALCLGYPARDAADVITQLGRRLYDCGHVRESFVDAALRREAQLPTGLPLAGSINAAIPHTECEHVLQSSVALATLPQPIVFQNMVAPEEPVPVRLVFLLALDQPKAQIEMLQAVAGVLQNPDVVARLMEATDLPAVQSALEWSERVQA